MSADLDPLDPVALTSALVRCASVTPEEGGALVLLQGLLEAEGFRCTRVDRNGIANLYARFGEKGPALGFNGHTDVVPTGDVSAWTRPPFSGEIAEGKVWGRGACDMKSGVAAWVSAAIAAARDGVRGSLVLPRPDGSTAFIDYTDNAASGTNLGLEWELDWRPTDGLALFASIGLLDATFDDYVNAAGEDLDGRDQAHAPNYQYAAGITWTAPGGWYLRAEAEGKDGFYFSDRHAARAGAYDLFHLRGGLRTAHWDASLWVRNLGDEDYAIRGFGSFGNDPRKGYAVEPYYQYGEPRVLGASLAYRF